LTAEDLKDLKTFEVIDVGFESEEDLRVVAVSFDDRRKSDIQGSI